VIPRVAHFVYGLRPQREPFHFLRYVAIESCRRVLEPERILFHHKQLPWGPWWERILPYLTLVAIDEVGDVLSPDHVSEHVPPEYTYAHHADFIRLDALIEHGGVYADIDTVFLRPFPDELFEAPFVIGREPDVRDELTGAIRPSLCNAVLLSEPGADFACAWRSQMANALNGTWSNHSGFLSEQLSRQMPEAVRLEPETRFFAFRSTPDGLADVLTRRVEVPGAALAVHLWAHLWWERERRDFTAAHGGWFDEIHLPLGASTLAALTRDYLDAGPRRGRGPHRGRSAAVDPGSTRQAQPSPRTNWGYLSLDEVSGYGVAGDRCMSALTRAGCEVRWTPFAPGPSWHLGYEPALPLRHEPVLIAHLVAEYLPRVRAHSPEAFLVAHTVWDTDRLPDHWVSCLDTADLIIVPSTFSADAIRASPVTAPVEVVPHVALEGEADVTEGEAAWGGEPWADIPEDVFVFYTIGDWTERKGISTTVEAYLRAFGADDRVLLIVKTSHPAWRSAVAPGTPAWSLAQILGRHRDRPPLRLVTEPLTDAEVGGLHRRGDCYVSLCRSEGFGLGAFDAATHGNPVVMTGFGGQLDYLGDTPLLVDFELVPAVDSVADSSYRPDQQWAAPDIEHGAALLRRVAADPAGAAATAGAAASRIRARFNADVVGAEFIAAVERHFREHSPTASGVSAPPS